MSARAAGVWLYLLNCALLFSHEIDSAYWQEWYLFGLPGGIQLFLVLNLLLLVVALYGFRQVVLGGPGRRFFPLLLAGAGLFAFGIHTAFLLAGHPEFKLPVSLVLLALILLVSLVQGFVTLRDWRKEG